MVRIGAVMVAASIVCAAVAEAWHVFGKLTPTSILIDHTDVSNKIYGGTMSVPIGDCLVYFVHTKKDVIDDIFLVHSSGKNISFNDLAGRMKQPGKRGMTGYPVKGDFTIKNLNIGFQRSPLYMYAVSTASQPEDQLIMEFNGPHSNVIEDFLPGTTTFLSASESIPFSNFYLSSADQVTVHPCGFDAAVQVQPVLKITTAVRAITSEVTVLAPIATVVFRGLQKATARVGNFGDQEQGGDPDGALMTAGGSYASMSQGYSGYGQNFPATAKHPLTNFVANSRDDEPRPVLAVDVSVTHSSPNKNDLLRVVTFSQDGGVTEHLFSGEMSGDDGKFSAKAIAVFVHWNSVTPDASYLVRIDTAENSTAKTGGVSIAVAALLLWLLL